MTHTSTEQPEAKPAAAPVVLPEPMAYYDGERWYANEESAICACADMPKLQKVYTEQQVRALLATGVQTQAVPDGWREQFATEVYADLEAADNQDVPLEEYPARILKVLDSTVGPRHPVVIKWRNDAIEQCIAIARKYCRDPESHKYLKQDLEAMLTSEPAPQAIAAQDVDAADTIRLNWLDAQVKNHAVHNGFLWQEGGWESDRGLVCAIQDKKQRKTVRQAIDAALAAQAKQGE